MSNDYWQQGDYYTSLHLLCQLTNRQLREEQLRVRRGPSLWSRIRHSLVKRAQRPTRSPQRWRTRLNLN